VAGACSSTRTQRSAGAIIDDSDDPVTKAGQIYVETCRGVVDNAEQKNQATKVARSVTGVKEVRNDLRISTQPHATAGQLTGFVESTAMKAKAGEIARSIDGIKGARNDFEIRQQ
jgi:osmotically-inducible protein OsmY